MKNRRLWGVIFALPPSLARIHIILLINTLAYLLKSRNYVNLDCESRGPSGPRSTPLALLGFGASRPPAPRETNGSVGGRTAGRRRQGRPSREIPRRASSKPFNHLTPSLSQPGTTGPPLSFGPITTGRQTLNPSERSDQENRGRV